MKLNPLAALALTFALGQAVHAESLQSRLSAAPPQSFEAGTYATLAAVEGLLQDFQSYAIGQGFGMVMGMRGREFQNLQPRPRTAETMRDILEDFLTDLGAARATLMATAPETAEPFVVDLATLWFDIDGDGVQREAEAAARVLGIAFPALVRGDALPAGPIEVRFDGADHAWLMAYTHVMAAAANMVLAFDPTPILADLVAGEAILQKAPTIPNTFDVPEIEARIARLEADLEALRTEQQDIQSARQPVNDRYNALRQEIREAGDDAARQAFEDEREALSDRLRNDPALSLRDISARLRFTRQQIRAAKAKLPVDPNDPLEERRAFDAARFGDMRDALYTVIKALEQQPDPDRLARAEAHWRAMLEQNRLFWALVAEETDNDREWVPNPNQESALGVTVDAELAGAWQAVLSDGEALLDGRLLIPHPLLPAGTGVSVARWLDDPAPLDLPGWIHGRAAYPYVAKGPRMTRESWAALQRLTGGNGFGFAIFLN